MFSLATFIFHAVRYEKASRIKHTAPILKAVPFMS